MAYFFSKIIVICNILQSSFAYIIFINKYLLVSVFTKIFLVVNNNLLYAIIYAVKKGIPPNNLRKLINLDISKACLTLGFIAKILLKSIVYKGFNKRKYFRNIFFRGELYFLRVISFLICCYYYCRCL